MASAAEQLAANMNFSSFQKATELHKRIWFTIIALVVYRLGTYVPIPGIDAAAFERAANTARFSSTLAMLAGAGVPILKALQAAAETLGNRAMRADAMDALVRVREGAPLAAAMAGKKRFPGLIGMFARLGEQTGTLPAMLARAASQLGNEVQRRALALATILEPLLIVAMGVVVMLIVLAVLLPIIQLNTWVK